MKILELLYSVNSKLWKILLLLKNLFCKIFLLISMKVFHASSHTSEFSSQSKHFFANRCFFLLQSFTPSSLIVTKIHKSFETSFSVLALHTITWKKPSTRNEKFAKDLLQLTRKEFSLLSFLWTYTHQSLPPLSVSEKFESSHSQNAVNTSPNLRGTICLRNLLRQDVWIFQERRETPVHLF